MSAKRPTSKARPRGVLTLADIVLTRKVGSRQERISGAELARLIDATDPAPDNCPFVDAASIAVELAGLSDTVLSLGDGREDGLGSALGYIASNLRRSAHRVLALAPSRNREPDFYRVERRRA